MDEEELQKRLERIEEFASRLWFLTVEPDDEGCTRGPPGRLGPPGDDPDWDPMIGILAGIQTTLEEAVAHIVTKVVKCKHTNTFEVSETKLKNGRVVKRKICRDCEHLVITSDDKIINVLPKTKPDLTIYDHLTKDPTLPGSTAGDTPSDLEWLRAWRMKLEAPEKDLRVIDWMFRKMDRATWLLLESALKDAVYDRP